MNYTEAEDAVRSDMDMQAALKIIYQLAGPSVKNVLVDLVLSTSVLMYIRGINEGEALRSDRVLN